MTPVRHLVEVGHVEVGEGTRRGDGGSGLRRQFRFRRRFQLLDYFYSGYYVILETICSSFSRREEHSSRNPDC